jgi:hypothetical protein
MLVWLFCLLLDISSATVAEDYSCPPFDTEWICDDERWQQPDNPCFALRQVSCNVIAQCEHMRETTPADKCLAFLITADYLTRQPLSCIAERNTTCELEQLSRRCNETLEVLREDGVEGGVFNNWSKYTRYACVFYPSHKHTEKFAGRYRVFEKWCDLIETKLVDFCAELTPDISFIRSPNKDGFTCVVNFSDRCANVRE